MQLINNIIYKILSLQEKFLKYQLSKTIGIKNTSKNKKFYGSGCVLDLNSFAEKEKEELEREITDLLKTYDYEPEKLLDYIKTQGTPVYYTSEAKKILNSIAENEGFIYPSSGFRALYLSLSIMKRPKFKTEAMFVLSKGEINKYYFIYHFYNWFAYKKGISGIDYKSQELLKKYLFSDSDTGELQLADIFKLKDAIKQDKASLEFVIKLCRNYDGAKNALKKLKDGGANL